MEINKLAEGQLQDKFLQCCTSMKWVRRMLDDCPFRDAGHLSVCADKNWLGLEESDYLEAFAGHPRIGDVASLREKFKSGENIAAKEQSGVVNADEVVLASLAADNRSYEDRFGFIFIVCATGKTAGQMLDLLTSRLKLEREAEIQNAAEQQRKIFQIRLQQLS